MICDVCGKKYRRSNKIKRYTLIEAGCKYKNYCCAMCAMNDTELEFVGLSHCSKCGKPIDPLKAVFDCTDIYCSLECAFEDYGIIIDDGEFK